MRTKARVTQRSVMRDLFAQHRGHHDRVIEAYATAERTGRVPRQSNVKGMTSDEYAQRLLNDGLKKGWLA